MDRFESMRIFTRIVERGSFTRAAEDLGLPRATVTWTIKELEARLNVRLLNRTTRSVKPTLDGDAYYHRCVRLLADLEEVEAAFSGAAANPKGRLRIDLHGTLAMHFVVPTLMRFSERYPQIKLQIGFGDRLVDLVREGVDCVLRAGELRDSSMVARRVADLEQVTVASPAYLSQRGPLRSLKDLDDPANGHSAVNFFSSQTGKAVPFEFIVERKVETRTLDGTVSVNSAEAYSACCIAGFGLIQLPRYHVVDQLAKGELREVLRKTPPPTMPVTVLYPHARQLSPRVRVFVDWLAEAFSTAR